MDSEPQAFTAERGFIDSVKLMLARPDYLLPLSAAERQFRDHYYGLNSAALLEDLFFDALGHFLRETNPMRGLRRPPTGQKGWDYEFDGMEISHKVGQSISSIAALWDVTKDDQPTWSFEEPIVYVLGKNSPVSRVELQFGSDPAIRLRSAGELGKTTLKASTTLAVVNWPADGRKAVLLDTFDVPAGATISDEVPFDRLWMHMSEQIRSGGAANELDVLAVSSKAETAVLHGIPIGSEITLDVAYRGGVYFFVRELLQDLPVSKNNRAILIAASTLRELLDSARANELFSPLPVWYWLYAMDRPPDMYSAQRAEYDALFTARSRMPRA